MSPRPEGLVPLEEPVYLDVDVSPTRSDHLALEQRRHALAFVARTALLSLIAGWVALSDGSVHFVHGAVVVGAYLPLVGIAGRRAVVCATTWWCGSGVGLADGALFVWSAALVDRPTVLTAAIVCAVGIVAWEWGAGASMATVVGAVGAAVLLDRAVEPIVVGVVVGVGAAILLHEQAAASTRNTRRLLLAGDKANAILASIGDAVVTTSAVGRIRDTNRAARDLLACEQHDIAGGHCQDVLGLVDGANRLRCLSGCELLDRADTGPVELTRVGHDGTRQPLLASADALRNDAGDVVEVIHSLRDITTFKQADEAKKIFLATTSHELKSPLTVIKGYAQLLARGTADDDARRRAVQAIGGRADELIGIVDRLLMSSRIDAGQVDLAPGVHPIAEVLRSRSEDLARVTGRVLEVDVPELPPVWCDESAFVTIVDHLLENALKYSPGGGAVRVVAELVHHPSDEDRVVVRIADEGIGMSEEQRRHCFERFWQAEGTNTRRYAGTGIGLYIVRSLADAMDVAIDVESRRGAGTTFSLSFRTTAEHIPAVDTPERTATSATFIDEFMRQVGVEDRPLEEADRG